MLINLSDIYKNAAQMCFDIEWTIDKDKLKGLIEDISDIMIKYSIEKQLIKENNFAVVFKRPDALPMAETFQRQEPFKNQVFIPVVTQRLGNGRRFVQFESTLHETRTLVILDAILGGGGTILSIFNEYYKIIAERKPHVKIKKLVVFHILGSKRGYDYVNTELFKLYSRRKTPRIRYITVIGALRGIRKVNTNNPWLDGWPYISDFGDRLRGRVFETRVDVEQKLLAQNYENLLALSRTLSDESELKTAHATRLKLLSSILYILEEGKLQFGLKYDEIEPITADKLLAIKKVLEEVDIRFRRYDDEIVKRDLNTMIKYGLIEQIDGNFVMTSIWREYAEKVIAPTFSNKKWFIILENNKYNLLKWPPEIILEWGKNVNDYLR